MEDRWEGCLLAGGDFNARTGEEGGTIREESEEKTRKSKNKMINQEGRILIDILAERGWMILNGSYGKDERWSYIAKMGIGDRLYCNKHTRGVRSPSDGSHSEKLRDRKRQATQEKE